MEKSKESYGAIQNSTDSLEGKKRRSTGQIYEKLDTSDNGATSSKNDGTKRFSRQQKLVLFIITIAYSAMFAALSIMAPFFPKEASKKGVSTTMSGLVFSAYALVNFLLPPFVGLVVERIGPRVVMVFGVALAGMANIIFGLLHNIDDSATDLFFWSCLVCRIFEGIGSASFFCSALTLIAQLFPENVGAVLGTIEFVIGASFSLGPAIGGFLYDWGGYELPFSVVGGILLSSLPGILCLPSDIHNPDRIPGNALGLLKNPTVLLLYTIVVSTAITWTFTLPVLEPHLRIFNLSVKMIGLVFLFYSSAYAICSPICGYFVDNVKRSWSITVVAFYGVAIGLILLGPSGFTGLPNVLWLNLLALVIMAGSAAFTVVPIFKTMLDFASEAGYSDGAAGMVGGLWTSGNALGEAIGPAVGAYLTHHFGFPVCTTVLAGFCVLIATGLLILSPMLNTKSTSKVQN